MRDNSDVALKVARKANSLVNVQNLSIPVLDGFTVAQNVKLDSKYIFVATKDGVLEQFLTDGVLIDNEKFEERVEKTLNDIRRAVRNNPLYKNNGRYLDLFEIYKNDEHTYKIYLQDIIVKKDYFVRQINAYFVEPNSKEFCQLSIAAGQFKISDKYKLLRSIDDYHKDPVIISLEKALKLVLDNIEYDVKI